MPRRHPRSQAFTLIELLLVVAIMALLAGILITGVQAATNRAKRANTLLLIKNIEAALKEYENTYGFYPGESRDGKAAPKDDPDILVRALVVSRKMEFKLDRIGLGDPTSLGTRGVIFTSHLTSISDLNTRAAATGGDKLWVLDYWGNPIHYVEYYSRNSDQKTPVTQNKMGETINHQPQRVDGVDIWSNGPDGNDDGGENDNGDAKDDVNNWQT